MQRVKRRAEGAMTGQFNLGYWNRRVSALPFPIIAHKLQQESVRVVRIDMHESNVQYKCKSINLVFPFRSIERRLICASLLSHIYNFLGVLFSLLSLIFSFVLQLFIIAAFIKMCRFTFSGAVLSDNTTLRRNFNQLHPCIVITH